MVASTEKIACAATACGYHIIADLIIERCLNYKTIACPPMTKRTVEIGARYSPDMVCTPFKTVLGNYIEALENGANVIVVPGAGCRLGFYDILQKQILEDLGYDFEMIVLFDYVPTQRKMFSVLRDINPELTAEKFTDVFGIAAQIAKDMDMLADIKRRNMAFELTKGEINNHYNNYLREAMTAQTVAEAEKIGEKYKEKMEVAPKDKPDKPIRIGIVGETYGIGEAFLNCNTENWLIEHGVEINRNACLMSMVHTITHNSEVVEKCGEYAKYSLGATASEVIAHALEFASNQIDGIIHIKPASCSPEISAMTILQNISRDFDVPILYMTFDTETSEAGVYTRLEAFMDMIVMKGLRK